MSDATAETIVILVVIALVAASVWLVTRDD